MATIPTATAGECLQPQFCLLEHSRLGPNRGHGVWLPRPNFMLPRRDSYSNQVFPPPESTSVSVFVCMCCRRVKLCSYLAKSRFDRFAQLLLINAHCQGMARILHTQNAHNFLLSSQALDSAGATVYTYRVKVINPKNKKNFLWLNLHGVTRRFTSPTDLKEQLMDSLKDNVPPLSAMDSLMWDICRYPLKPNSG